MFGSPKEKTKYPDPDFRETLSKYVSLASIIGVIALAGIVIGFAWSRGESNTMTSTFSAVLPMFGVWLGTVLAFYFGKENFEAATRSVTSIAQAVGPMEKLRQIPITSKMRARKDMIVEERPAEQIKLTEILTTMKETERLPILNDKSAIVYMIHRSYIDRYLAQKALKDPKTDLNPITLKMLLDDDTELKKVFEHSFAIVGEDATLADAKIVMESNVQKCQDVFVTENGKVDGKVIGWITNNKIQDAAML
jgi:hypothetical protein